MTMRRCDAEEHHYDDSKYSSCPHCRTTVPYIPPPPTVIKSDSEPAKPDSMPKPENPKSAKTVLYGMGDEHVPVVGWLVILEGPADSRGHDNKGRDLRLIPGMNRVGRGSNMDVTLDFGDKKIGRTTHCSITFDPESNRFFLVNGDGRNLTHLHVPGNSEDDKGMWDVVLQPRELSYMDKIKVGDTVLVFIPFCTDEFQWNFDEL